MNPTHTLDQLTRRFMRIALLLPLLLPALLFVLAYVINGKPYFGNGGYVAGWRSYAHSTAMFTQFSLVFGGIPYVVFYLAAYRWQARRNTRQIMGFIAITPFVFYLFEVVFLMLAGMILSSGGSPGNIMTGALVIALFVFPIGYSYIILILLGYAYYRRFRLPVLVHAQG